MTNEHIIQVLREAALAMKHDFDPAGLHMIDANRRGYLPVEIEELKRDLEEAGRKMGLLLLEYKMQMDQLHRFLNESKEPILLFQQNDDELQPVLLQKKKGKLISLLNHHHPFHFDTTEPWLTNEQGEVITMIVVPYKSIVSSSTDENSGKPLSPFRRLVHLLSTEKKDIVYILIYAVIIGLVSLVLPLGLQTTVELISGGVFFSSIYILIGLVILGVIFSGVLQIVQLSLVEHLQRRVFTKAAFEFAYRIPRIRLESLTKNYAPELVNRFFDILTIQKGLPKLLIDISSGAIQIFFGLLLLSLYHPFFVFFGLFLLIVIALMFSVTGPRGLKSSLSESKYKYKVVQWLEELARVMGPFKLAGNTNLPVKNTDFSVSNYLKHRKTHFTILQIQFSLFVFFKVAVTGGLLIMGTSLVINREINLGQFVASEVIIIMVLSAVEKLIMYIDVVYDLLTAVDKIGHVTDLPLEKSGGFDFPKAMTGKGFRIDIHNLCYQYQDKSASILKNINLSIQPGERICIAGRGGSGKSTLTNIMAGLYTDYQGSVAVNQLSLHDLDITHFRDKIGKNISEEDIFDGTIYDNITMGKSVPIEEVVPVLDRVGLKNSINIMPEGIHTWLVSGGKGLTSSQIHRLILSRCLVKKPELLILNDFFSGLGKTDKQQLVQCVIDKESKWTLVVVSNDPMIMASCDRVVVLDKGEIAGDDTYQGLVKQGLINHYFE